MKTLAAVAAISALTGLGAGWFVQGLRWEVSDARRAVADAKARAEAEAEFNRRLEAQQEAASAAAETLRRARLDAAAAGRAADSLRGHVATLAGQCAAPAAGSASGAGAGDVLADMLGRLEAAGRELAAEADRARAAGAACERAYDSLKP